MAYTPHGSILLPCDKECKTFRGFVGAAGRQFVLEISLPSQTNHNKHELLLSGELLQLVRGYDNSLQKQLEQCRDQTALVRSFLPFLQRLLQSSIAAATVATAASAQLGADWTVTARIVSELQALGWDRVDKVDASLQRLELRLVDTRERRHALVVQLPADYPRTGPQLSAALPEPLQLSWTPSTSLTDVYEAFAAAVGRYQRLWDMVEELYANVRVLDPPQFDPRGSACRLALPSNVSLQLQLDATDPNQLPEIRFLGPEHATRPLEEVMARGAASWSQQKSALDNLRSILGSDFALPPSVQAEATEDGNLECGICFVFKLGEELPDKVCEDARCARPFHTSCLAGWLHDVQTLRNSFDTLFGECPYCNTPISVRVRQN